MFGHLFDDMGPAGGEGSDEEGSEEADLLSSGESGDEEGDEGEDGWTDEDDEGEGRARRRRPADEMDELFGGEVRGRVGMRGGLERAERNGAGQGR